MKAKPASENGKLNHDIIQWGRHYLSSHGYILKNNLPEDVKSTPWSYVIRFLTTEGYIYLKHTPKLLALEASITQILYNQFHASVPKIIANNTELNCFLMKDVGVPLREILKRHFNVTLFCQAIDQFASMQLAVVDHVNVFLDIGVPDWRLDKLPDLFKQLILQKDLLIADGLSEEEIKELELLLPQVYRLCEKLSAYNVKQTIVQCDFHDNNILIGEGSQNITLIDLGEIVISHPFFSLVSCLWHAKYHHALTEENEIYQQLKDTCFKNFKMLESKEKLLEASAIAKILWFVYESLAKYRLMLACDKATFMAFQRHGRLKNTLQEFIKACITTDG